MKAEELFEAINNVDEDLLLDAYTVAPKKTKVFALRYAAAAAVVVVAVVGALVRVNRSKLPVQPQTTDVAAAPVTERTEPADAAPTSVPAAPTARPQETTATVPAQTTADNASAAGSAATPTTRNAETRRQENRSTARATTTTSRPAATTARPATTAAPPARTSATAAPSMATTAPAPSETGAPPVNTTASPAPTAALTTRRYISGNLGLTPAQADPSRPTTAVSPTTPSEEIEESIRTMTLNGEAYTQTGRLAQQDAIGAFIGYAQGDGAFYNAYQYIPDDGMIVVLAGGVAQLYHSNY